MDSADDVLASIDLPPHEIRSRHGARLALWVFFDSLYVLALLMVGWALAYAFSQAWTSGQWDENLWRFYPWMAASVFLSALLAVGVSAFPAGRFSWEQVRGAVGSLRAAGASGDDGLAPLCADQAFAVREALLPALPCELGPFKRPVLGRFQWEMLAGVGLCCLIPLIAVAFVATAAAGGVALPVLALIVLGVALLVLFAWGLCITLHAAYLSQPFQVRVGADGLHWRRPGDRTAEQHLPWGDIHSFCTFTRPLPQGWGMRRVFVVEGRDAALAWEVKPPRWPGDGRESDVLVNLIHARTELPLRDLTDLLKKATVARWSRQYPAARAVFTTSHDGRPALWPEMPRPTTFGRTYWPWIAAACLVVAAYPGAFMAGQLAERAQAQEYIASLHAVRAHTPLYQNALRTPSADWLTHAPTSSSPARFSFAGGGYAISLEQNHDFHSPGTDGPGSYRDVAVQVTVRLYGNVAYPTRAGLIVHDQGDALDWVMFTIQPDGSWQLMRYGPGLPDDYRQTFLASSSSSGAHTPVHTQPGAPNRLSVIMRGDRYSLYVNDTFVGVYTDPAPRAGAAGLTLWSSSDARAVFSDFTVYPV